jgi:hypothetical protein
VQRARKQAHAPAGVDQLRAHFNANAFSGRVEGGYGFVTPWIGGLGITPYAAGQFTTFDLPAYAENRHDERQDTSQPSGQYALGPGHFPPPKSITIKLTLPAA